MGCSRLFTGSRAKQGLLAPQSMAASLGRSLQSVLACTADNIHRMDRSSLNIFLCLEQSVIFNGSRSLHGSGSHASFIASVLAVRMRILY